MLGRLRELGGFKSGEYLVASGSGNYVGGTPAQMTTGGTVDALSGATPDEFLALQGTGSAMVTTTGGSRYLGVFMNCKAVDQLPGYDSVWSGSGSGKTFSQHYRGSLIVGTAKLRFQSGTKAGLADGFPYETGDSWAVGDKIFVSSAGTWTNTPPSTGSTLRGMVEEVGTNYIDVVMKP